MIGFKMVATTAESIPPERRRPNPTGSGLRV